MFPFSGSPIETVLQLALLERLVRVCNAKLDQKNGQDPPFWHYTSVSSLFFSPFTLKYNA
jgi:hypothetical protein